jgi:hypothetical protein
MARALVKKVDYMQEQMGSVSTEMENSKKINVNARNQKHFSRLESRRRTLWEEEEHHAEEGQKKGKGCVKKNGQHT